MKYAIDLIYGPQTIGLIFIFFGIIQKVWPPKRMDGYYGYNSPAALTSQAAWTEANRYAPIVMIRMGLAIVLAGLIIMTSAKMIPALNASWTQIGMFGVMAAALAGGLIMRKRTDGHIKQKFGIDTE